MIYFFIEKILHFVQDDSCHVELDDSYLVEQDDSCHVERSETSLPISYSLSRKICAL